MGDEDNTLVSNFVFFENDFDALVFVEDCFETLSHYFGEEVCGVVAYSLGRGLGERFYKLAVKQGVKDLKAANAFLAWVMKRLRLAKDAAIFVMRSRDDLNFEVLVKIASSGRGERSDIFFYILRGIIFQFYRLFTLGVIRISSLNRSNSLKSCYEYVVKIVKEQEVTPLDE